MLGTRKARIGPPSDVPIASALAPAWRTGGRPRDAALCDGVVLVNGEKIRGETIIWTAGVRANPVVEALSAAKDRLGRVLVNEDLELPDHPDVSAIGDCAHFVDPSTGQPLPPAAQVAGQQAAALATTLARRLTGEKPLPFRCHHQGALVSPGSHHGVAEIRNLRVSGFAAWLLWRTVVLSKMIGLKNRFRVALDWTISLFFGRDTSRLEW